MKGHILIFWTALALLESSAAAQSVPALNVVSDTFQVDRTNQQVIFSINFDRAPDVSTLDAYDRPADQFQLLIDTDEVAYPMSSYGHRVTGREGDYYSNHDVDPHYQFVVGAELTFLSGNSTTEGELRQEDASGNPTSITPFPFTLDGTLATITIPFSDLGPVPGQFGYIIEVYQFGASRYPGGAVYNPTLTIPLPEPLSAAWIPATPMLLMRRRAS